MKAGYEIFLMIELARNVDLIGKQLEYDTTWNEGTMLYYEFTKSEFNVSTESEYDCIVKFLKDRTDNLNEVELNIIALTASFDGDMNTSNKWWKIIEDKGYRRLDYTLSLSEIIKLR